MKKITLLLSFVACVVFAHAQAPIFVEDFNYTIGSGIKAGGWAIHSGAGATPDSILVVDGLSFAGYAGSGIGGAAAVTGKYADQNKSFPSQTSGTTYVSFMMKSQGGAAAATYFMHFGPTVIGTTFFSRIWINITGTGLGLGDTAPATYTPIAIGTTYLVVLKYDFATKTNSLYVFSAMPTTEPTTAQATFLEIKGPAAATPTDIGSIAMRQGQSGGVSNQNVIVDGIHIATSWSSLGLITGLSNPSATAFKAIVSGKNLLVKNVANGSIIEIFSALGAKVQTSELINGSVGINNLSKGLYIVRVGKNVQKIML